MRLLKFISSGELSLASFVDDDVPQYAVLSHTWGPENDEVTFKDLEEDAGKSKYGSTGYKKIQFCGKQAACHGISYFWVDTCCIDKSSSAELSEAINSMFKWYRNAARCFAYLSDVPTNGCDTKPDTSQPNIESAFRTSRWFTRGWTLQELIAPSSVEFFSREGELLGSKTSLERQIHEITGIPVKAIQGSPLSQFTVEERMIWAVKRTTTRKEDEAYCLLGIFDIFMPLLYGEGKEKAFIRLQEAIDKPFKDKAFIRLQETMDQPLKMENLLSHLPYAIDAPFNTLSRQHDPTCLPDTRVDLLREIYNWADGKDGRFIYWLNGLAGTGKSTIARTVARKYFDNGQLGASFFFSRGGGDVGQASKFFTSIAVQLARKSQPLQQYICDALRKNADIGTQSLGDQWRQVVLGPLSMLSGDSYPSSYVLVIDALDECDNDKDIGTIIKLLAEAQTLQTVRLRVLLTSRPEIPIRHGFYQIPETEHQDFVLHHISPLIVDHDITIFLNHNLGLIRQEKPFLGANWPGEETVKQVVQVASGLFIWAATACRFIQGAKKLALIRKRLATILKVGSSIAEEQPEKYLDQIYITVLRHSIPAKYSGKEKEEFLSMLKDILGAIAILLSPLSVCSLSRLLDFQSEEVDDCLEDLHAILDIPRDHTRVLRLHHPSFRDFLLNNDRCSDPNFWVDKKQANDRLAARCIQLMSTSLKEDICGITIPGTLVTDIKRRQVEQCLPLEVQYACLHWVKHLRSSDAQLRDNDSVHQFLQKHLLHWLEALGWMQKISDGIHEIISLESMTSVTSCRSFFRYIHDVKRFALHNRAGIEHAPLQVYYSALFFTPRFSIVRKRFSNKLPRWIKRGPEVDADWSATLQILEGHSDRVNGIAFSPDGKQLASGSYDTTVRIWDAATGATLQILEGHSKSVNAVAFSSDGKQLASGSADMKLRIWDTATGATLLNLEGHSSSVTTVAFSPNGKQLASGSNDMTVQIWDPTTGATLQIFEGHSYPVNALAFSPDGKQLASGSSDTTVRIWDPTTGATLQIIEGHSYPVNAVAFSSDSKQLASSSYDNIIRIWDAATGTTLQIIDGHSDSVNAVTFSSEGKQLASGSNDYTVRIWDAATGATLKTIDGHSDSVNAVTFSPDGKQLASGSNDYTVRIWDAATGGILQTIDGHSDSVKVIAFSPDGKQLASGSGDTTVRIWDAASGATLQTLKGHGNFVNAVAFSPDSKQLASSSYDNTIRIWDAATGATLQAFYGYIDWENTIAFSPDGKHLASGSYDHRVRIWDLTTRKILQTFAANAAIISISYSSDGSIVTNCGRFDAISLQDNAVLSSISSPLLLRPFALRPDILVQDEWIVHRGNRMLWLHPDYRHSCSAVYENTVCLGHPSGRVSIFEFSFSSWKRKRARSSSPTQLLL